MTGVFCPALRHGYLLTIFSGQVDWESSRTWRNLPGQLCRIGVMNQDRVSLPIPHVLYSSFIYHVTFDLYHRFTLLTLWFSYGRWLSTRLLYLVLYNLFSHLALKIILCLLSTSSSLFGASAGSSSRDNHTTHLIKLLLADIRRFLCLRLRLKFTMSLVFRT